MPRPSEINIAVLEAIGIVNTEFVVGASIELRPDQFPFITVQMAIVDPDVVKRLKSVVTKFNLAPSI